MSSDHQDASSTYIPRRRGQPLLNQLYVPTLTLLGHPDLDRVGERCVLAEDDRTMRLRLTVVSRNEPRFTPPRGGSPRGLEDRQISQKNPLLIHWRSDGGVDIEVGADGPEIRVDGRPLTGRGTYDEARVKAGLVVTHSARVVLLVHRSEGREPVAACHDMIGESDAVQGIRRHVERVANEDLAVLIRGESGVGKERVADAIHKASHRASRDCVAVNMAAINLNLAESEFFGHVKGAFANAIKEHGGYIGQAEGGTLFLDEVGETPRKLQLMLLRFLEGRTYQRVGSSQTLTANVRIVAATDADLEAEKAAGHFDDALYFRLARFIITVPPLRERKGDIGRLMAHFVKADMAARRQSHRLGYVDATTEPWLPAWIVTKLATYPWPGNVRELRDVVGQLVLMHYDADEAALDARLKALLAAPEVPEEAPAAAAPVDPKMVNPRFLTEAQVRAALADHGWGVRGAAKALGIAPNTLYKRMDAFGIRRAGDLAWEEIQGALLAAGGDEKAAALTLEVGLRALRSRITELQSEDGSG